MIFAIDFDGTIGTNEYPKMGELVPLAKEVINKLHSWGHEIIIWSCRYFYQDIKDMKDFLKANEINYDKINENSSKISFKPWPKIYADVYIDDRNFGGFSWEDFDRMLYIYDPEYNKNGRMVK